MKNLKDILYQAEQSIEAKKSANTTDNLAKIFHRPAGEANTYV